MSNKVSSDSFPFMDQHTENVKKDKANSHTYTSVSMDVGGHSEGGNSADDKSQPFQTIPSNTGWYQTADGKVHKKVKTSINIRGGKIGTLIAGQKEPLKVTSKKTVYEDGANNMEHDISDGTFVQTNIGGTGNFNNVDSEVKANIASMQKDLEVPTDTSLESCFTPEQVTIRVLKSGIQTNDLISLLERNNSIANLAFALPENPERRDAMVRALLLNP